MPQQEEQKNQRNEQEDWHEHHVLSLTLSPFEFILTG
jgi:hypothetical protein